MRRRIGIIGAGVAGLHLGLYLVRHGVDATIVTDADPRQVTEMRLVNTVAHNYNTVERERLLDVCHWPAEEYGYAHHYHYFSTPEPIVFDGRAAGRGRAVDHRIYLARLMEDFAARGGVLEYGAVEDQEVERLARRFDLLVVGSGRGMLGQMFEPLPRHSPYLKPPRALNVGLYTGVRSPDPIGVTFSVSPGHGELIDIPILSFGGRAHAFLMENTPGGDLEDLARLRYDDDARHFLSTLLGLLERHHPTVYDRIDTHRFDLQRPQDHLVGGVVPTVRRSFVELPDGKIAIAAGDVHSVSDPLLGQGANMASYAAWVLGEEIVGAAAFDALFCEKVDRRRSERVLAAQRWTNLMLEPPGDAMKRLLLEMTRNQTLADRFTDDFNYPERQWEHLATPERIRRWLAEAEAGRIEPVAALLAATAPNASQANAGGARTPATGRVVRNGDNSDSPRKAC